MSDSQPESTRPPAVAPGNVAVITGGASGIGLAVAEALIAEGMSVVLADIDAPKLRDVEARLTEDGASVATMICNTTAEPEVNALIEYALEQFGAVHVMFNNAGIGGLRRCLDRPDRTVAARRRRQPVRRGARHPRGAADHAAAGRRPHRQHRVDGRSRRGAGASRRTSPRSTPSSVSPRASSSNSKRSAHRSGPACCVPGFVKTDLMNKEPASIDSPLGPLIAEFFRTGVETGIPASDVADQVVAAIKAGQFWILTHEDMRQGPVERMQRAADGINPTLNIGS